MNTEKENNCGYFWVTYNPKNVLKSALEGGMDSDKTEMFVGKAKYKGDWMPAKVMPKKNVAYVAYDGKEVEVKDFEVLCKKEFVWVQWKEGDGIPNNAFKCGSCSNGEELYVGRASHKGSMTIGKFHPSHKAIYIPYGGHEVPCKAGEILVYQ